MNIEQEKLTRQQQKALHVGFQLLADALNDSGYDMRFVLNSTIDIAWTPTSIKEYLWRPVQKVALQKTSTTELDKLKDIEFVWDTLFRHLGERCGIEYIEFPSNEKDN